MLNFIKLSPGEKKPDQKSLDDFYTDLSKLDNAAILLNKETVVVDFDEFPEIGRKLLEKYPTMAFETKRGIHLYYKRPVQINGHKILLKNWTKKLTVSGAQVDYKTGNKSTATIKQNGQLRKMHGTFEMFDDLPALPLELLPVKVKNVLAGMKEGARNSSLYSHLMAVREMYELDYDTLTKIAEFINDDVYEESLPATDIHALVNSVSEKEIREQLYLDPKDMIITSEALAQEFRVKFFNGSIFHKEDNYWINDRNKRSLIQ